MIYEFVDASDSLKLEVWQKGISVAARDPNKWRKDHNNHWMHFTDFMDSISKYGWGIEYIVSPEEGGTHGTYNLRPVNIDR